MKSLRVLSIDWDYLVNATTAQRMRLFPDGCVIASNSLLNKDYSPHVYSLIAGSPAQIKREGITINPNSK